MSAQAFPKLPRERESWFLTMALCILRKPAARFSDGFVPILEGENKEAAKALKGTGKDRRNLFALCQRNAKHRQPGLRKGGGQPAA